MITKYNDTDLQNLLSFIPGLTGRTVVDRANLYYSGAIAGTEFEAYDVTKIYLCRKIIIGAITVPSLSSTGVIFYNQSNAVAGLYSGRTAFSDCDPAAPVINYDYNDFTVENILFSRLARGVYSTMLFYGMRITLSP